MSHCNHENIIKRAMFAFWKHGYSGCSVKTLEHATGLHSGSIYYHFKSKDCLYQRCVSYYLASILLPRLRHVMSLEELKGFFFHVCRERPAGVKSFCFLVQATSEVAGHTHSNQAFKKELYLLENTFLEKIQSLVSTACEVAGLLMDLYIGLHVYTEYNPSRTMLDNRIRRRFEMIEKVYA